MLIKLFITLMLLSSFLVTRSHGKTDIECVGNQDIKLKPNDYGNIYSVGYKNGSSYPYPMSCSISLSTEFGRLIRLTFNEIDIALNNLCQEDNLIVTDFGISFHSKNELFCGKIKPPDLLSSSDRLKLRFQASPYGTGSGFNITYREVSALTTLCKRNEFMCRNRKCVPDDNVRCNGKDDCGDGTDEQNCDLPVMVPKECGTPEVKPQIGNTMMDRIVGGREAVPGSWPWQVDMQMDFIQPNGHTCGGTLIDPQWFITAAHCISRFIDMASLARIHLGNHHKYQKDPFEVVRYMKDFFVYGVETDDFITYKEFNITHNLALVKLSAPVSMNPHIQVACLPEPNEELKVGQKCYSTGWGATKGSGHDDVLKQAEHPIQPSNKCLNDHIKFVNETMICAGRMEPLHGICHEDSGGPLVCQKDGKWHVYGVTSFPTAINMCGIANKPSVFSKISAKLDWIRSTISNNS